MAILGKYHDARLFMGGYNLSGHTNSITLAYNTAVLDGSCMGNATKIALPGITEYSLTASGQMLATAADALEEKYLFDSVGGVAIPFTVFPGPAPAEGDRAFFFTAEQASHSYGAPHGALLPYNITAQSGTSGYPLQRGYVLEPGAVARTTTAAGTGTSNPGAVAANQYLYAVLHVFAVDTPTTLDVIIQSDADGNFAAGATTRITFTQVTTSITSQYAARVAGPISDEYWRCSYTIAGTSYTFCCAMAIGS